MEELRRQMNSLRLAGEPASDVVTVNAGGRLFTTQRRTLCLVEESLLALMFGGGWPEGCAARDAAGNVFLDVDPALFEVVLAWLRKFRLSKVAGPGLPPPLHEPEVPPDKTEHMLALLDYLQLHRHVPLSYRETFSPAASPFMMIHQAGAFAARIATAPGLALRPTARVRNSLMQFAVSANSFFDMAVDLTLDVFSFANSSPPSGSADGSRPSSEYMFVGFVHRDAAAMLDPTCNINTQLTKLPSCYGWLTGRYMGYQVRNGKRSTLPCQRGSLLWSQGDQLLLSLDCRRGRGQAASITLTNTTTGLTKTIACSPTFSESSSSGSTGSASSDTANGTGPKQQQQQQQQQAPGAGGGGRKRRPGMRHRAARFALAAGPDRDEVLQLLRLQQPAGVEAGVGELVAGAALQLLEARGYGVDEALAVLRQPGWLSRLAQQVRSYVLHQGQQPAAQREPGPGPAAAAAAGEHGAPAGEPGSGGGRDAAAAAPLAAAGEQQDGKPDAAAAAAGSAAPESAAAAEWVLVVGLVHPSDSVRIVSAKRRGQHPCEQS